MWDGWTGHDGGTGRAFRRLSGTGLYGTSMSGLRFLAEMKHTFGLLSSARVEMASRRDLQILPSIGEGEFSVELASP